VLENDGILLERKIFHQERSERLKVRFRLNAIRTLKIK